MPDLWKKIRWRLEVAGLAFLTQAVARLPRRAVLALAQGAGNLVFALDSRGRQVAIANIEAAFGDRFLPSQRREIARRSYQNFARAFFDLFWARNMNAQNFTRWFDLRGFEDLLARRAQGGSEVIVCHHFGNFELNSQAFGFAGLPVLAIAQDFKNPGITPIFAALREAAGIQIIPRERAVIRLLKELKRGGITGLVGDLTLKLDEPGVLIETFGLKKWATSIHALLSQRTGARITPFFCLPKDDGRYEVRCLPALEVRPNASPQEITQQCWDALEPCIRDYPHLWLWTYKHWRYRPRGASGYPFYANSSDKFERILHAASLDLQTGQTSPTRA